MEHTCNFIRQGVESKLLSSLTQKFGSVEDPTLSTFHCSARVVCTLWWGSVGLGHIATTRRTTSSEGSRHLQIWGPRSKCCRYISWPVLGRGRAARSIPACCGRCSNVGQNVSSLMAAYPYIHRVESNKIWQYKFQRRRSSGHHCKPKKSVWANSGLIKFGSPWPSGRAAIGGPRWCKKIFKILHVRGCNRLQNCESHGADLHAYLVAFSNMKWLYLVILY